MQQGLIHLKKRMMTAEECEVLLEQCSVGRIGTVCADGTPYITPVNYVYDPDTRRIYIHHSGKGGRVLDNLKGSNNVCFEADVSGDIVNVKTGRHICDIDQAYRSVICTGCISIAGNEEKLRGLRLLGSKYAADISARQIDGFDQSKLDRLVVLVIDIKSISGKCREPKEITGS